MKFLRLFVSRTILSAIAVALFAGSVTVAQAKTVSFAAAPWPGVTVKTEVAQTILEAMGYETKEDGVSWTIALQGVARGDYDVDLGIWLPTQKSTVEPMAKSGKIDLLVKNVPDAKYDLVVPKYVWDAGVHSIADLNKHADKFGRVINGIEAGNDGNELMKDAIKNNTYDLGDWTLRPSSTAAMLAEAGRAIKKHQWIVFLGWKPHWMNIKYDLKYLEDPEKIWGGGSSVWTAINPEFKKNNPNVTRFLKQMIVPSAIQSEWINDFGQKHMKKSEVARNWIADNMDVVAKWLDGVTTADGSGPALDAVKKALAD